MLILNGQVGIATQTTPPKIKGSDACGLPYPAFKDDPPYHQSESAGVEHLTKYIMSYLDRCEQSAISPFRYSRSSGREGHALWN